MTETTSNKNKEQKQKAEKASNKTVLSKLIQRLRVYYHLHKNRKFWQRYYSSHRTPPSQSLFAEFCLKQYIKKDNWVLELGCGNGRDALFFAANGINVLGLDLCREEISFLNKNYKSRKLGEGGNKLRFKCADFTRYKSRQKFDVIYSRFTIHSISEEQEVDTIKNSYKNLIDGGVLLIEARSMKDDMFSKSEKLSNHEGVTDHYRRFIDLEIISNNLRKNNFEIMFSIESRGLAIYKDEDPYIIRIAAKK